jgi:hypothetical protein
MIFFLNKKQNYPYFDHTQLDGGASIMQMYQLTQQMTQVPMTAVQAQSVVPTTSVAQSNVNYSLSDNAKYGRDVSSINQVSASNVQQSQQQHQQQQQQQQQQQPNQTMAHNYSTYPWIFPSKKKTILKIISWLYIFCSHA